MKNLLILIVICCSHTVFSQTIQKGTSTEYGIEAPVEYIPSPPKDNSIDNNVYNTSAIDIKPEFPGGNIDFDKFIEQNFKLSKDNHPLNGKIYATFIVEKDGSLSDIKILRDIGYETGAEAIRVLKLSPKWSPGKINNKLVRVMYALPISVTNSTK